MDLVVNIPVETQRVEAALGALADEALQGALAAGLAEAAEYLAGAIVAQAVADGITPRSPAGLLTQVGQWPGSAAEGLTYYVGVPDASPVARYAYLLTEADKHIVPLGHKYLAIPVGPNLTGGGLPRLHSPRELGPDIVWRGRTAGLMVGDRYEAWFALTPEVWIFGRGSMERAAEDGLAEMIDTVQRRVDELLK